MSAEQLGRRSLAFDAGYCAGAAFLTVARARPLARLLAVPTHAVVACGLATFVWAAFVADLSRRPRWRSGVRAVALANGLASTMLLGLAVERAQPAARALLAATGLEVAGFAVAQSVALRRAAG